MARIQKLNRSRGRGRRNKSPTFRLGNAIANRRRALELTQEALAKRSRLSRRTVQSYEAGNQRPTIQSLLRVCAALGQTLSELLVSM